MIEWKPIVGFDGYEVSSTGLVRTSHDRAGHGRLAEPREMKQSPSARGDYWQVVLVRDGRRFCRKVHRLVLEAFVGPCPSGMESCHKDGSGLNNVLGNLRWGTHSSNLLDRREHGTATDGEKNPAAKLSANQVRDVRVAMAAGEPSAQVAGRFGVHRSTVELIAARKTWGSVA